MDALAVMRGRTPPHSPPHYNLSATFYEKAWIAALHNKRNEKFRVNSSVEKRMKSEGIWCGVC